jgi:hypothetical protein
VYSFKTLFARCFLLPWQESCVFVHFRAPLHLNTVLEKDLQNPTLMICKCYYAGDVSSGRYQNRKVSSEMEWFSNRLFKISLIKKQWILIRIRVGTKKAISDYFEGKSLIKLKIEQCCYCITKQKNQQLYM